MKRSGGALLSSILIDRQSKKKINTQIYMGIRQIILTGGLTAGERLPASRTLAKELNVSRTTIINALDRLISEGVLEARSGAGTFVSEVMSMGRPTLQKTTALQEEAASSEPPKISDMMETALPHLASREELPRKPHAFITGLPALDDFPMAQWARLSSKHWRGNRSEIMGYGKPYGLNQLRQAISTHVNASRGIQCEAEQIFITGGAQHAFQLIGNMLLNSGDKVWIENPGAIGARNSLIANGAKLVPVEVDEKGISVEDGMHQAPDFRLAFVTPSHQQPLSVIMGLRRRFALLKAAEKADAWIIEDDYDSEFHFEGQPLPTLKSVDTAGRVIYVGTFSKTLFPSLRTGFIISPPRLVPVFQQGFNTFQAGVPTNSQATIAEFMDEGFFATHIRRMRGIYAARYQALIYSADEFLSDILDVQPTQSGLHTVGYLKSGLNENDVTLVLAREGITVRPLDAYCLKPIRKKGLVLGFGAVTPAVIKSRVKAIAGIVGPLISK
ncbi:MAG: PLP-dependent aminotransferase family protein [Alphaproteobacteria bacterium]|nr:MAG: PLP-dependent aminotransferase family protein [Alphaproteobacteria bacterium]